MEHIRFDFAPETHRRLVSRPVTKSGQQSVWVIATCCTSYYSVCWGQRRNTLLTLKCEVNNPIEKKKKKTPQVHAEEPKHHLRNSLWQIIETEPPRVTRKNSGRRGIVTPYKKCVSPLQRNNKPLPDTAINSYLNEKQKSWK